MMNNYPLEREELSCRNIQVVVLMGGLGTRLREKVSDKPKSMVEINGKPFFQYQFELLLNAGFRRFVFLVGYKSEFIEEHFGDGKRFGTDVFIQYSYDGEVLLGTAGAIVNALSVLDDDFLLIYGDSFMDVDYFEIIYRYYRGKQVGKSALMAIMENAHRFDKSNVVYLDGRILCYDKRNTSADMRYIDYGIEMFNKEIFAYLPRNEKIDLADIQRMLVAEGKCEACEETHRFYEIGTPESLEEFRNYSKRRFEEPHSICFIDRDGVINEIVFNEDTEQLDSALSIKEFAFRDDAVDALKLLSDAGIELYVITNQPAAAKGKVTLLELYDINHHMVKELEHFGISIAGVSMCPHHPLGDDRSKERFLIKKCTCRKPDSGMIEKILAVNKMDADRSYVIGDSYTDVAAGKKAGVKTAFLGDFKCDVCGRLRHNKPDIVGAKFIDIVEQIVKTIDQLKSGKMPFN